MVGSNNDIDVIHLSLLFNELKDEEAPDVLFVPHIINYKWVYYLVDRIYLE